MSGSLSSVVVAKGITAAAADYAFPKAFHPEAGRSGKKALVTGAKFAAAGFLTEMTSFIPTLVYRAGVTNIDALQYVTDGIYFSGIEALVDKNDRSAKRVLMNALYGVGMSAVAVKAVNPAVAPMVPMVPNLPATPIVLQNQASATTSPGFSS